MKTAVIIGSTGLVGRLLVKKLAREGSFGQILAIVRRPPEGDEAFVNPRVRTLNFDFENWADLELQLSSFAGSSALSFFCCLGTTIGKAGSQVAFRKVDLEHVVSFAKVAQSCRAEQLLVVSAMGADAGSKVFYNQIKGEMEKAVENSFSGVLHFFRPSLLLGDRKDFRFGERLAILTAPLYGPLLPRKYQPVKAEHVAACMLNVALRKIRVSKVIENPEML